MAQFHFVEDYEKLVNDLVSSLPLDEAMARAVGGNYEGIGDIEVRALKHIGLKDGMAVIDLGCGSGRLAHALGKVMRVRYRGIDIVQALLDYARTKSPPEYDFVLHRRLDIPAASESTDMITAFSVFTHLLQPEIYIYLQDMRRVLRKEGLIVFSFIEFAAENYWKIFENTVIGQQTSTNPHLNMFIERSQIEVWARHLDLRILDFIDGTPAPWGGYPLGQSIAVLQRP